MCAACVRDAAGRSDRGCAGGAERFAAGAAAGCGAADLCIISPGGARWLRASERGPGACCGTARAWRLCGFGILPNKFLQRKGPCMYRAIACRYNVIDETKIVSSPTVIWLCRFPKHSNIEVGLKVAKLLAWFPFRNY